MPETRRDLMRKSGQLAAAGVVVSTAGCLRQIPVIGPIIAGKPLAPSKWVGAPGVIGDSDHGNFFHGNIKQLLNNEDNLNDDLADSLTEADGVTDEADLDPESAVASVSWSGVNITQGNFNKSDAVSNLEDADFDEEDTQNGFTIMVGADDSDYPGQGVGISGNKVIEAGGTGDMDPDEVIATAIDVGNGNEDRFADENEDFQTLLNKMGIGTITSGRTFEEREETSAEGGRFEGNLAAGTRYNVNGENTDYKAVYVFGDEGDVDTGDIEDFVEAQEDSDYSVLAEADGDINVNKNGRAAVVKATVPSDEVFGGSGG